MVKYIEINNLKLLDSYYGVDKVNVDVTSIIKKYIEDNQLLIISNKTFNKDPIYGVKKYLKVIFDKKTMDFEENDKIIFYNKVQSTLTINSISDKVEFKSNYDYILFTYVKDETNIIEWIIYHLLIGFTKILIIDNNSKISVNNILKNYRLEKFVDVIEINKTNNITNYILNNIAFNYLKNCNKYFINIDINEYINLNSKYNNIVELLNNFNNPDILMLNCVNFGSGNLQKNTSNRLISTFKRSSECIDNNFKIFVKATTDYEGFLNYNIVKNKELYYTNINNIKIKCNQHILNSKLIFYDELSNLEVYINNYKIQSKEDYFRRKIYRNKINTSFSNKYNKDMLLKFNDIINNNLNLLYSNLIEKYIDSFKIKLGFIILRYVNNMATKYSWINCYTSLRKLYNDDFPILIIDDNSDDNYLTEIKMTNTKIIKSEFPRRGELLPYYYYLKNKFCDRVCVIHDSMMFENYFDFNNINNYCNYTRLFSFSNTSYKKDIKDIKDIIKNNLENGENIINYHNKNINNLLGCFGVCFLIDYNFLFEIEKKYKITNLVNCILNRNNRKTLERLLSLIFFYEEKNSNITTRISLFGDIQKNLNNQKTGDNIYIRKNFYGR